MGVYGDSTRTVEVKNNRGIEGSTAISAIPEGFCYELENATLDQAGVIKKRPGYNVHGSILPVKCRPAQEVKPNVNYSESVLNCTPIITLTGNLHKFNHDTVNTLGLPFNVIDYGTDNNPEVVAVEFTNVPSDIELTVDHLFFSDHNSVVVGGHNTGHYFTALEILGRSVNTGNYVAIFPKSSIQWFIQAAEYNDYLKDLNGYSVAIQPVLLHQGHTFQKFGKETLNTFPNTDGGGNKYIFTMNSVNHGLKVGASVYFEYGMHWQDGADARNLLNNWGLVYRVNGTSVYIVFKNAVTLVGAAYNYCKVYYINTSSMAIYYDKDIACYFKTQALTFDSPFSDSDPIVTVPSPIGSFWTDTITGLPNKFQIIGANTLLGAASSAATFYLFGSGVNVGYVGALQKYFNKEDGFEKLVCVNDGTLFDEQYRNLTAIQAPAHANYTGDYTIKVPKVNTAADVTYTITLPATSVEVTFNFNVSDYYRVGDILTNTERYPGGIEVTEQLLVESFSQLDNKKMTVSVYPHNATPADSFIIRKNSTWNFTRTSNRIYLDVYTAGYGEFFAGRMIQLDGYGADYTSYLIRAVQYNYSTSVRNWVEIEETVTYSSGQLIYKHPYFSPVVTTGEDNTYYSNKIKILPLDFSQKAANSNDMQSVNYDYAVYISAGIDGIYRYDGKNIISMKLPAPPLAYWRTLPNTSGNLPTKLGENGKYVGEEVSIRLTYIFTDAFNRDYESAVSPDNDIIVVTQPVEDYTGNALNIEVIVPNIPSDIGYPADKIRIRAYRQFLNVNNTLVWRVDSEVDNDPYMPFSSLILGTTPTSVAIDRDELYSVVDIGSNRPAPLASCLSVLENKIVAANGYEAPRIEIGCEQTFENENTIGSYYAAWSQFQYNNLTYDDYDANLDALTTKYNFVTVPLIHNSGNEYDQDDVTEYPAAYPDFRVFNVLPFDSLGKLTIDTGATKGIDYSDTSNTFEIKAGAAITATAAQAKLRIIDKKYTYKNSIDFNYEVFNSVTSGNNVKLTSTKNKWLDSLSETILGNDSIVAAYFELAYDAQIVAFGSTFASGSGYLDLLSGAAYNGTTYNINLHLKDAGATLNVNDYIVIQMLKGDTYGNPVEDNLGLIKYKTTDSAKSWNSELIFKVAFETADTPIAGVTKYSLVPVELTPTGTSTLLSDSSITSNVLSTTALAAQHGQFQVFKLKYDLTTANTRPVLDTSTFSNPSKSVTIYVTSDPTGIAAGDKIVLDMNQPDFESKGFPYLKGVFEVTSINAGNKTITFDALYPSKGAATVTKLFGDAYAGYVFSPSDFFVTDTYTFKFKIDITTLGDPGIVYNDWVFLILRGYDHNSVSTEFSGWFKVMDCSLVAGNVYSVRLFFFKSLNANYAFTPDFSKLTGLSIAKMIHIPSVSDVTGDIFDRYVPVPVPYKCGLAQELLDLSWPMFEQKQDVVYTPLWSTSKRFAMAFNTILRNKGFAYWGGVVDEKVYLYPSNGFSFISHKYPIDYSRYFDLYGQNYVVPTITATDYKFPFDYLTFSSNTADYYKVVANLYDSNYGSYSIDTVYSKTTDQQVSYFSVLNGSTIWWSSPATTAGLSNRIVSFKYLSFDSINSADGENIVGLCPYQNYIVIAKNTSIFRTNLTKSGDKINTERAQSTVGVVSGKNMIATESYMYFIHLSGVYYLEGLQVIPETTLNRYFDERVYQNVALLPYTAGYHNPLNKEVVLGIPYSSSQTTTVDTVNGQFVYNYNEGVFGWSVNLNIAATWWINKGNDFYFSSIDGAIYKKRTERNNAKYRDVSDPIAFKLRTRYVDMENQVSFKFIRNFIIQLGLSSSMNVTVNYTWDYFKDTKPLTIIPLSSATYTASPYSTVTMVSNKFLKPVRGTVQPNRVAQLGLEIINNELDANVEVFGIFIEGQVTNNRLVTQKNQTR